MLILSGVVFAAVGLFSALGGLLGYRKAGSRASLIAGGVSGLALMGAAAALGAGYTTLGLCVGEAVSLLLGLRFIPSFLKTRKVMPQGVMAGLSVLGVAAGLAGYGAL